MTERTELTAAQALAVLRALTDVRNSASGAGYVLAAAGLGELPLWRRMDALEAEMQALLVGLQPAFFLEQH